MTPEPIDLLFQGLERGIGVYLLKTSTGPALFDCGPSSCLPKLRQELGERGLAVADLRHLLLSHIHFDHAGAAGPLVRENPALRVHVSPVGAPHLADPSRLEQSARRIYGDDFDTLWGELAPVPERNIEPVGDHALELAAFPSPGHAKHHVSYIDTEGTLYDGDASGMRITPHRYALPVAPPPDIDVEAWELALDEMERRAPARIALVHFGVADDVEEHLACARKSLRQRAGWVRDGIDEEEFVRRTAGVITEAEGDEAVDLYQQTGAFGSSWVGFRRYWDRRQSDLAQ